MRLHHTKAVLKSTLLGLALSLASAAAWGQATDADKSFIKDTAQDTNFEIKTGQLALQKSASPDVKAYANMVIHDHTRLKQTIAGADSATGTAAVSTDNMGVDGDAKYAELKVLTGKTFDDAYIKGLVKGNEESIGKEKTQLSSTNVPAVKRLAQQSLTDDTKHAERAKQLAAAHNIQP